MTEADFEREANKLLRDLGLPSDTLNFFESDSAKTSDWKSGLKAPSPPKARRVSSTGTTTQFQRRQRERAATATANGPTSIKRPERSSIPWRNPPSQDGTSNSNTTRASANNRFSSPSGNAPSSIPVSSVSKSQPPQNLPDQPPQASSTPTKRQAHRPAPRAPPSNHKSRRASTPSRTSVSPTGPAQKSPTTATLSQGSGIPVFSRRLSPAAASQPSTTSTGSNSNTAALAAANSNKPSHLQKPTAKTTVFVSRPALSASASSAKRGSLNSGPIVNSSNAKAVDSEDHTYESIDGNLISSSSSTTKSSSPPKPSMLKKPGSRLSPPKHQEIIRRLSAPEKHHNGHTVAARSESQKVASEKSGTTNHKHLLQLLSVSTKSSTKDSKQTSKPTTDAKTAANSTKIVRPERTSVLSYSRIPITSSKTLPPPSSETTTTSVPSSTAASSSEGSRIPQPGGFARGGTWAGKSGHQQQQHQQQQKVQEKPQEKLQGETRGGNAAYDSLSPSDLDAILKQDDSFLLEENNRSQKADANVSGVYDRLTPKEIMMILQGDDVPADKDQEKSPRLEQNGDAAVAPTDPVEHLYAKVNKRRRHSEDQETPENRQSLTSPISDPGTADPSTNSVVRGKRHSADETVCSDSRGSSNPPRRSSSHEQKTSEKLNGSGSNAQNGRSSSTGSATTGITASSPESMTDRQTPDSDERRSRISINWSKQSLDNSNTTNTMNAVASSTVQALQTLVEVMTPQPSPVKSDGKKFNYEDETSSTPWYLLDTEENESTGSSHPLSPDPSSEPLTIPTNLPQAYEVPNGKTKVIGKKTGRRSSDTSKPHAEPSQSSSNKTNVSVPGPNAASNRRRNSGQMSDSSRKSSSASNPPADPPQVSSGKTSLSGQAGQSSHGSHGNHLTVRSQPNWPSQTRKTSPDPPPPISRTLSSPEHDYAILDPEFNEEFFGYCTRCNKPVIGMETGCLALDEVYHLGCFTCSKCHASLSGQNFYALGDNVVCEADFLRTLERCHACKQRIRDRVLRACGQCYHPSCFRCVICGLCLDGVPYIVSNSLKVYCIHDYHKKHAPKCAVCGDSIIPKSGRTKSLRVTASGKSYHVDCYKCEDCGKYLASKGGGEKCYPLEGHLYCRECNAARVYQWYKLSSDYEQEPGLIV